MLRKERWQTGIVSALLFVATLVLYWPLLHAEFIHLDDPVYVRLNPFLKHGLTGNGVLWAFQTTRGANWHPLTWLSHMLDVKWFGFEPGGHHLTNILLHAASTLVLFFLIKRLTADVWRSAMVAALFAFHPLHVESVAWISERKDVLSTFFGFLSLWAYACYARNVNGLGLSHTGAGTGTSEGRESNSSITHHASRITHHNSFFYLLSLALFACSLMSKAMLVTLPFLLLLLDYWPLRRFDPEPGLKRIWLLTREKLPFFGLSAAISVVTLLAQSGAGAVASLQDTPFRARLTNAVIAGYFYLRKTLWPRDLAVFYPYQERWAAGTIVVALLCLAGMFIAAFLLAQRQRWLTVGWLWFVGTLVPVIGLVQVGSQSMADRYTYVPSIGLFILLVWACSEVLRNRIVLGAFAFVVVTACLSLTCRQVSYWRNTEALARHAINTTKGNYVAHSMLGSAFLEKGLLEEAKTEFVSALDINSGYATPVYGLGKVLIKQGKDDEAIDLFRQRLEFSPNDPVAHHFLASLLQRQKKLDEAVTHLEKAVEADPGDLEALNDLADLLVTRGEAGAAFARSKAALRLDPHSPDAHVNAGGALLLKGQLQEALPHYEAALRSNPGFGDAHLNYGKALMNLGRLDEAAKHLVEAARLEPENTEPHRLLASIYGTQQRPSDQASEYAEMIRLAPDWAEALNNFAWLRATHPDPQIRNGTQAVSLAEHACQITQSTNLWLLSTLAAAYAEAGKFSEAADTQQKVCALASAAQQTAEAESLRQRLALYKSGQAYHRTR
jgi:protein O-mannosyl-transferase